MTTELEVGLYIFILAGFLGYHVITRVPPLLHTPLMSATNAISGISLIGSLVVAGADYNPLSTILGTIAKRYTHNVGYPGFSNAAIDEIFNTNLIPQMFAQVAQKKMTASDAASAAQHAMAPIFRKWRSRKKI